MDLPVTMPPTDLALPTWLRNCLATTPNASASPYENSQLICHAFEYSYLLHQGQKRASGDPYIAHPVAVAGLLRDLGGSEAMIAAGFLHDVVEDTDVTLEELEELFGREVRLLVEGVTKISKFNFSSQTEQKAENFRRMFLAMAQDIRVIVVKLADRLHNMRTLEHLRPEKQRRIAQETKDVFAPLADRLGIWTIKCELEELSFQYIEPELHRQFQQRAAELDERREARTEQAISVLQQRLQQMGLKSVAIESHTRHFFSAHKHMVRKQKTFDEIYDVTALRLIAPTADDCYRCLAAVHNCFRPIPGRFKDHIGLPKPNLYQSLHTVVMGHTGRPIEVQIRTQEMHHVAEYGIAAHWKFQDAVSLDARQWNVDEEKLTWLRQLLEWQQELIDAQEYLDGVKGDLFDNELYVFTPKGDLVSLVRGATPVDFAYRIHTEVGHQCCAARVNGQWARLDRVLANGDSVEIITQSDAQPSLDWLNFVMTSAARSRIRQWYKRSHHQENINRGRAMLAKAMGETAFESLLESDTLTCLAQQFHCQTAEELFAGLGEGGVILKLVINQLRDHQKNASPAHINREPTLSNPLSLAPGTNLFNQCPVAGTEGLGYHLATCCNPVPGVPIVGEIEGECDRILIHHQGCEHLADVAGENLIPVDWNPSLETSARTQTYPVAIHIKVIDRVGILKDILTHLTNQKINVRSAQVKTYPDQTALIDLNIDIEHMEQLNKTLEDIKKISDILSLKRVS